MIFQPISAWMRANERKITALALLTGFIVDNFTLTRIDQWLDNLILLTYICLAAIGITFVNLYESGKLTGWFMQKLRPFFPILIQYAFGGLFSGFFIFYSRSASIGESWIFLVILVGLLIGNEAFKRSYMRFTFQTAIFFISIYSYLIFFLPIVVKSISVYVFIASGILSLFVIYLFLKAQRKIAPGHAMKGRWQRRMIITTIFLGFNFMYFTNIIPPIPLSLKDAGVYHYVENTQAGTYVVLQEVTPWYDINQYIHPTIHITSGKPVYFYNAVFSPTDLNVDIIHSWEIYDEAGESWDESFRFPYHIVGGREGGYRGYSIKEGIWPGKWRVKVMNEREQVLGQYVFYVETPSGHVPLETIVKE